MCRLVSFVLVGEDILNILGKVMVMGCSGGAVRVMGKRRIVNQNDLVFHLTKYLNGIRTCLVGIIGGNQVRLAICLRAEFDGIIVQLRDQVLIAQLGHCSSIRLGRIVAECWRGGWRVKNCCVCLWRCWRGANRTWLMLLCLLALYGRSKSCCFKY